MRHWIAPYRLKKELVIGMDSTRLMRLISEVRKRMIVDAQEVITVHRLHNPSLYLWDKRDENGDFIVGFFIGDALDMTKYQNKERFNVFEKIEVSTSEKGWLKRVKDWIHEKTTGEKPNPKTLNPYH